MSFRVYAMQLMVSMRMLVVLPVVIVFERPQRLDPKQPRQSRVIKCFETHLPFQLGSWKYGYLGNFPTLPTFAAVDIECLGVFGPHATALMRESAAVVLTHAIRDSRYGRPLSTCSVIGVRC